MFLPQPLFDAIEAAIRAVSPNDFRIQTIAPIAGGDINKAYQIKTQTANYFVKVNNDPMAMKMFLAESTGLTLIRKATSTANAPHIHMVSYAQGEAFLLMEWIDAGDKHGDAQQEALGRLLARLHRQQADQYGLDHDNFIGKLQQHNVPSADWTEFFTQQRLQRQLEMADHLLPSTMRPQFERLFSRMDSLYPKESPSLLHGDLWGGNYLVTNEQQPVLIDPAVYYGHREVDIAMTKLFGGFSQRFYAAYHEAYPLQPGWEQRTDLWNLYPLLVHLNLFGRSYLDPLQQSLSNYL